MPPPSAAILSAFRIPLTTKVEPLVGGQESCYRAGDVVMKPIDGSIEECEWVSGLMMRLCDLASTTKEEDNASTNKDGIERVRTRGMTDRGYRVARPIPVEDSTSTSSSSSIKPSSTSDPPAFPRHHYVHESYAAQTLIPGHTNPRTASDWRAIFHASIYFHADLKLLASRPPDFIAKRTHRWAWADRIAWDEARLEDVPGVDWAVYERISELVERVDELIRRLDLRTTKNNGRGSSANSELLQPQLIHGDLTGNVLFIAQPPSSSPSSPLSPSPLPIPSSSPRPDPSREKSPEELTTSPGIIDLSLYWRPLAYAHGVVVCEGLVNKQLGADPDLLMRLYLSDEYDSDCHPLQRQRQRSGNDDDNDGARICQTQGEGGYSAPSSSANPPPAAGTAAALAHDHEHNTSRSSSATGPAAAAATAAEEEATHERKRIKLQILLRAVQFRLLTFAIKGDLAWIEVWLPKMGFASCLDHIQRYVDEMEPQEQQQQQERGKKGGVM